MSKPEPGSPEWESMVDFMRADLESGMAYSKIEMKAREMFKEQGRDFNKEFQEWKEKKLAKKYKDFPVGLSGDKHFTK